MPENTTKTGQDGEGPGSVAQTFTPQERASMFIEWCALKGFGTNGWPEGAFEQLTALTAMSPGWRPIESAPKNISISVYVPNAEHYGPGIYRAIWVETDIGRRWHMTTLHAGRDAPPDYYPTYWQPLPAPPMMP